MLERDKAKSKILNIQPINWERTGTECLNDSSCAKGPEALPEGLAVVLKPVGPTSQVRAFFKGQAIWRLSIYAPHWWDHIWSAGLSFDKEEVFQVADTLNQLIATPSSSHGPVFPNPELVWVETSCYASPRPTLIFLWETPLHHFLL